MIIAPFYTKTSKTGKLIKSIAWTNFKQSHVNLHSETGNRVWQLAVLYLMPTFLYFQIHYIFSSFLLFCVVL